MVRSRTAVQVLLLLSITPSGALALPATYSINFTTTSGSPSPTLGTFTFDSAAAPGSQFTAFVVVWDGLIFDFTSLANTATVITAGCESVTSSTIFQVLSGTNECPGSAPTYDWHATEATVNSGFTLGQHANPYPQYIFIDAIISRPCGRNNIADGTYTITPQAPMVPPNAVEFGMVGLAPSQTLQLSVIAYKPQPVPPYDPFCIAQLGFANSSGGPVGPTRTVNLCAGQGDSLDLNGSTLTFPPGPIGGRMEVLPVVTVLPSPGGGAPACLANAEIVDSFSGFSLVLAPGAIAYPPQPVFGLQGVAWGQVLRLNVVAFPPVPIRGVVCVAQLSFVDKLGNAAGPTPKMVNLSSGHADFLDVVGASLVAHFGQRAELRPVITMLPSAAPSACVATAEVYDQFSGRTWAWANPIPI